MGEIHRMKSDKPETLPMNVEAEQQVLGSVLMNNQSYYGVQSFLKEEHFSEPIHREIWRIVDNMIAAGNTASPITVKTYLPDQKIGEMTLGRYMAHLAAEAMPASMTADAAREVVKLWIMRQVIEVSESSISAVMQRDIATTASSVLDRATSDLGKLQMFADRQSASKSMTLKEALSQSVDATAGAYRDGTISGYDTGLGFMNDLTGPWLPGQYIIIGAATKMGKSSLAMQSLMGIAAHAPVLYFSFEMNAALLAGRILSSKTRVGTLRQRRGDISPQEFEKLNDAAVSTKGAENLHIRSQRLTIEAIMQEARRFKREHGQLAAVVVDHLGILAGKGSDWELAAHASPIMKEMAEELDCVTIGLSQVLKENPGYGISRRNEEDTMKAKIAASLVKPHAGMLKGPAGNDADHVIMPFRAEAMLSKIEPAEGTEGRLIWEDSMREHQGKGQIILALSREAQWPKSIDVKWDGPATEFKTLISEEPTFGDM